MQNKKYNYLARHFRAQRVFRYEDGEKGSLITLLHWIVINANRGIQFYVDQYHDNKQAQKWMIENPESYHKTKQFGIVGHGGIEIHSPVQLDDLFPEPSIEYCSITGGKCWNESMNIDCYGYTLVEKFLQFLNGNFDDDIIFEKIEEYWHCQWKL